MYTFVFICALLIDIHGHLSHTQQEKAKQNTAECVKESGVKKEVIDEAKKGRFADDEGLKKFILCFFEKASILDHDGNLDIATALFKLPDGVNEADAKKKLQSCKSKTGKSAADKAFEITKCYHEGGTSFLAFNKIK